MAPNSSRRFFNTSLSSSFRRTRGPSQYGQTGRSANALKRAWAAQIDAFRATQLRTACGNDEALYARVLLFAGLVRDDNYTRPVVIPAGSVYVTAGAERRSP